MKLTNALKVLFAAAAIVVLPSLASAQVNSVTDTEGDVSVDVQALQGITLLEEEDLYFGTIQPFSVAGEVTIVPDDPTPLYSNVIVVLNGNAGTWLVEGTKDAGYDITFPGGAAYTVDLNDGAGHLMTVKDFTTDSDALGDRILNGAPSDANPLRGSDRFNVGATLEVGPSQLAGHYAGFYTVTVSYN
jgi:hypothetical protein